jgi:hypothetical protein
VVDDVATSGKRNEKAQYDRSMGVIVWLAGSLVVWALVLIPYLLLR